MATTLVILAIIIISGSTTASAAQSDASVRLATKNAITLDCDAYKLPAGFAVGRASSDDHQQLRDRLTVNAHKFLIGALLTRNLNNELVWADAVSTGNSQVFDLEKRVEEFQIDSVVINGDAATASGDYVIYFKHAQVVDTQGHVLTWGGWSTESFTASLAQESGVWKVSELAANQTDAKDDPSADTGYEYVPAPAPKGTDQPAIPVLP